MSNFEGLFADQEEGKEPVFKFKKKIKTEKGEELKDFVSVCGVELPVNTEGRGSQFSEKEFEDFSFDDKSLELLEIFAITLKQGQMPLIEGPTDIGKSKTLEYLAYITNNYLIYQSFSGQTDVSELIGKYVPNTEDGKATFERMLGNKNRGSLKKETMMILQSAPDEGLSMEDCKNIAKLEGMNIDDRIEWVWQNGTVPRAMEESAGRGCWLYFDELGAAEPQILVKLNRIISRGIKELEITENGGREVIAGKDFWLVGTTNPPSYAGREPFEKDFIRRWVYKTVSDLSQEDFIKRLNIIGEKQLKSQETFQINSEIINILNSVVANFRELAQSYLESVPKESGEQEFRFSNLSDAIRVTEFIKTFCQGDFVKTLKQAINFYYLGKIYGEKKDSNGNFMKDELMKTLDTIIDQKNVKEKIQKESNSMQNPEVKDIKQTIDGIIGDFD